jgi:hypothetical protein
VVWVMAVYKTFATWLMCICFFELVSAGRRKPDQASVMSITASAKAFGAS